MSAFASKIHPRVLLVDNFDSFTYNLSQMLESLDAEVLVRRNNCNLETEFATYAPTHVIFSPGPGSPEDAGGSPEFFRFLMKRLQHSADETDTRKRLTPILGVCLGHQMMAQYFGAKIVRAPAPCHGKTSAITHNGSGIFGGITSPMMVARYHSLVADFSEHQSTDVAERNIEICASFEDLVMAIQHRHLPVYGIQFHPESFMTPEGNILVGNFLSV